MESSTGECKRIQEVQFEAGEGDGGRRALKLESVRLVETLGGASDSCKRRKLCCHCLESSSSSTSFSSSSSSTVHPLDAIAVSSDHSHPAAASGCSTVNSASSFYFGSQSSDLKVTVEENSIVNLEFRGRASDSSEVCGHPESTMESPNSASSNRGKMKPSPAEIEEFFSAAEKDEQKRFADKYNYDIVRDVPLQGRYQWVRLKE